MDLLFEEMLEQSSEDDTETEEPYGADVIDLRPPQDPTEPDSQNPQT